MRKNQSHTEATKLKIADAKRDIPATWNYKNMRLENGIELYECSKCHEYFPVELFFKDNRNKRIGITSKCKRCHTETNIKTRNIDNARRINREYMRRARKTNPEKFRIRERINSQKRVKDIKIKARSILNNAVLSGKVVKPTNCSQCGKMRKLTAHHNDYNKPLEVRWLCYECHSNH